MCSCSYINKINHHYYHSLLSLITFSHTHSVSAYEFTVAIKTSSQGVYTCINGLDYYLDTPVSCDHIHTRACSLIAPVCGDHRALCVIYVLIKWWVIDLPGID